MIWQATGVSKYFRSNTLLSTARKKKVLSDISLHIARGEFVGLVGESGCGKTTLARIAMRLEPADTGEMSLDGIPYSKYRDKSDFYRRIQMVFQHSAEAFNPGWTVREILEEPLLHLTNMKPAERDKKIGQVLNEARLKTEWLQLRAVKLSGGQCQRVAIARALIIAPRLVILDEPTSSLDVMTQKQILGLLRRLHQDMGTSFLMITHDLEAVSSVANRIIFLDQGSIVEEVAANSLNNVKQPFARKMVLDSGIK